MPHLTDDELISLYWDHQGVWPSETQVRRDLRAIMQARGLVP